MSKDSIEIKYRLEVGKTYAVHSNHGFTEISLHDPTIPTYLPFEVTSDGKIKRGGLKDTVDISLVPEYLKKVYGFEFNEKELTELGILPQKTINNAEEGAATA